MRFFSTFSTNRIFNKSMKLCWFMSYHFMNGYSTRLGYVTRWIRLEMYYSMYWIFIEVCLCKWNQLAIGFPLHVTSSYYVLFFAFFLVLQNFFPRAKKKKASSTISVWKILKIQKTREATSSMKPKTFCPDVARILL